MSCASITTIATQIWRDLGEPTDMSVSYIQSKLVSETFLGQLDVALGVCHNIVSGDISPPLNIDEQGIYALMYQRDFYGRKLAQLAQGLALPFTTLQEGDSRITRVSIVELQRIYLNARKELTNEVDRLATTYRLDGTFPSDVRFYTIDNGFYGGWGCGGCGPTRFGP